MTNGHRRGPFDLGVEDEIDGAPYPMLQLRAFTASMSLPALKLSRWYVHANGWHITEALRSCYGP